MNLDDFSYEENDRRYLKPEVSLNEQNAFIDALRNMQRQDTDKIKQDTYNLGTAVPSNIGGLSGGSSYFTSRFQTPQTNSMVSDLRAAAQSQALSTVLKNELEKAQKRYKDAYRAAAKRASGSGSGTGTGSSSGKNYINTNTNRTTELDISEDPHKTLGFSVDDNGNTVYHSGEGQTYTLDNLTPADNITVAPVLPSNVEDGTIRTVNGRSFIYNKALNKWYRVTG